MISVLLWWTFYFYICNVQRTESVRLFDVETAPTEIITRFTPRVVSKTCMLIPEQGPCRSRISMWYFEFSKNNCSTFDWGGCQGNGNRFDTFSECWGYCMSKPGKYRPRYCSLSFDYGYCFGAAERWYYDAKWKVCKSTIYSGCGGNKNNFYNQEECEQICRFGNAALTRSTRQVGGTRKVIIVNPWDTTPKRGLHQVIENKTKATVV